MLDLTKLSSIGNELEIAKRTVEWSKNNISPLEKELKITKDELNRLDKLDKAGICSDDDIMRMKVFSNKTVALNRQLHLK
ncbi:hypothetical protein Cni_G25612 [Canna indica]|uniref:Uncharacterized protein n=1 Tax=Canna indica TaxID=4628 RepID=A0AAQ3KY13_9LILI|nr:hypothetical protein Cni_G25612 [Canna indica]